MFLSLRHIEGYRLLAQDGEIGKVKDFYFDDESWAIRYLVADTGKWLPDRKVLIARSLLVKSDWNTQTLSVAMSKDNVANSPPLDQEQPVSRQKETELHDFYGLPYYWTSHEPNATSMAAGALLAQKQKRRQSGDPHLRSVNEVRGYHIHAEDGEVGHVEDFIVQEADWYIKYMIVDTRNWLPGRKVLLSLDWISKFDWSTARVDVDMSRDEVKNSPLYDPHAPVNREYEAKLYDFYGRPYYWQ